MENSVDASVSLRLQAENTPLYAGSPPAIYKTVKILMISREMRVILRTCNVCILVFTNLNGYIVTTRSEICDWNITKRNQSKCSYPKVIPFLINCIPINFVFVHSYNYTYKN